MFYSIQGQLVLLEPDDAAYSAAVETDGGVAYQLRTTAATASQCPKLGERVKLYTHFAVRENAVDLFGFYDLEERRCFRMLVSVSGVGPRFALAVLSVLSPSELALCVASGDSKTLTRCKGIGVKTAQRIVLELKDKFGDRAVAQAVSSGGEAALPAQGSAAEAVSALMVLGYTRSEAAGAVAGQPPETPVEQLIKHALKQLAKQ